MKHLLLRIGVLFGLCPLMLAPDMAYAERRVALVIGNSAYQNVPQLDNPVNDSTAIAELLRKAGFEVVAAKTDLGVLEFKRALREFINTTRNSDIAIIYYAGHGIEVGGVNYMIPVDAKLANDLDAEDEAVDLDRIVRALEPAKRLRVVIIDACRDNPFGRKMQRTIATRGITAGLAKVEPASTDTLIAYAAKAGSTAEDGTAGHSPFTTALLNHLAEPGLDVRIALGRVRDEVLKKTANRQEPFVYGSLGGATISLVPAPELKKVETSAADMRGDYELAERVGTLAAWNSFLALHGTGFYSELARAQRAKLLVGQQAKPGADRDMTVATLEQPAKPAVTPERAGPDRLAWDKIQNSSDPAAIRDFIKRFPSSPLAPVAQHRLDMLEQSAAQRRQEEAERQKAAAEAARAKMTEAERQKAEREAARQREEEERRAKAAEAVRQKTEREAALRQETAAAAERKRQDQACKGDEQKLARLRAAGRRALDDISRFAQELTCERIRPDVVALLDQVTAEAAKQGPLEPEANTPALVRSAQSELRRIGCYAGGETGSLDRSTKQAIESYFSKRGQKTAEITVTAALVSELKRQSRVEQCIAALEAPKREPAARAREKTPEPEAERRREKQKAEEKREARPRQEPERAKTQATTRPSGRSGGGTMTGIGF